MKPFKKPTESENSYFPAEWIEVQKLVVSQGVSVSENEKHQLTSSHHEIPTNFYSAADFLHQPAKENAKILINAGGSNVEKEGLFQNPNTCACMKSETSTEPRQK